MIQDACEDMAIYPMMINNSNAIPFTDGDMVSAILPMGWWPMVRPGYPLANLGGWKLGLSFRLLPTAIHHGAVCFNDGRL